MRKLVLLAALLSCGASAVNLSELKAEEICVEPKFVTMVRGDYLQDLIPEVSVENSTSLIDLGFVIGKSIRCKYKLLGSTDFSYFGKLDIGNVTATLSLYPIGLPSHNTLLVRSGYETTYYTEKISISAINLKVAQYAYTLYDAFIKDWKQAHPEGVK
ncbi:MULTISPECIES: hypothetical protein [Deinococcus]|uniref:DUF302 domain-containing protein n=1 Tax=Deinococcus rufus TaxID=2136097 RepID=A0ABV7Z6S4_9DEIO|nr:hypothetical protein [Deinococcus sp. AB2017081]WQE94422.1 hypothetical protein U2P90_13535 [Deinococcus sp. AB2017081]